MNPMVAPEAFARDTRTALGICLSVVRNRAIEGARGYGVFRL